MRRYKLTHRFPAPVVSTLGLALMACGPVSPDEDFDGVDEAAEAQTDTDAQPYPDDSDGESSGGGAEGEEDGSTSGAEPEPDLDSSDSQGETSSGGDGDSDEPVAGDTGGEEEPIECEDDAFEDNDSLGYAASWNGQEILAISCHEESDFFQILTGQEWGKVTMEQGTDPEEGTVNLVLEMYCGHKLCTVDDAVTPQKVVDLTSCGCPHDERIFVHVVPDDVGNPPEGTRYILELH